MSYMRDLLSEGDMRTIGRADEAVRMVLAKPELVKELIAGLEDELTGVRMRSADALEKISAQKSELLQPYVCRLVEITAKADQQEVQWHMAQIAGRLVLDREQLGKVVEALEKYLETSGSNIVKVFSLQAMADLSRANHLLKTRAAELVKKWKKNGSPAVVSRCKKLEKELDTSE